MLDNPIKSILKKLKNDEISALEAEKLLLNNLSESIGSATIDHARSIFKEFPEVIFAEGKNIRDIIEISKKILNISTKVLITRLNQEKLDILIKEFGKKLKFNKEGKIALISIKDEALKDKDILVISAGTTDIPVAEEAIFTIESHGYKPRKIYDVGVAGISRILNHVDLIQESKIIIVVAGMEGALPSVVSGLSSCPVISVPTSIGYGSSYDGLAALLGMLNSCSPGIGVVNIDNGFGAGYLACSIIRTFSHPQ